MERERFEKFTCLISGIYRNIQKLKTKETDNLNLKNVHIFWIYLLGNNPEGLSASELAQKSMVNRALVSREIEELIDRELIVATTSGEKRRYGWKFVLTDKGREKASEISRVALSVQEKVDFGISEGDLAVFYDVLGTLFDNFETLSEGNCI